MNTTVIHHLLYLLISVITTVWVAKTLHKHGRVFLVDAFHGNENLADSVNHLLVVGFYLINVGFVVYAVKYGDKPTDITTLLESLGTKVGTVLLLLGGMHFMNVYIFNRMRKEALLHGAPPPVRPTAHADSVLAVAVPVAHHGDVGHGTEGDLVGRRPAGGVLA